LPFDGPSERRFIRRTTPAPIKNPARPAPTRPTKISGQDHVAAVGVVGVGVGVGAGPVDDTERPALPKAVSPVASAISTTIEYVPGAEGSQVRREALDERQPAGRPRYEYVNGPNPPATVTLIVTVCPAVTDAGDTVNCWTLT